MAWWLCLANPATIPRLLRQTFAATKCTPAAPSRICSCTCSVSRDIFMFATANIQFAETSFCLQPHTFNLQRQLYFCNWKCSICRDNLIFAAAKQGDSFKKISSWFLTKKFYAAVFKRDRFEALTAASKKSNEISHGTFDFVDIQLPSIFVFAMVANMSAQYVRTLRSTSSRVCKLWKLLLRAKWTFAAAKCRTLRQHYSAASAPEL